MTMRSNAGFLSEKSFSIHDFQFGMHQSLTTLFGYQLIYGRRYRLFASHRINEQGLLQVCITGEQEISAFSDKGEIVKRKVRQDIKVEGSLIGELNPILSDGITYPSLAQPALMRGHLTIGQYVYVLYAELSINKRSGIFIKMLAYHDTCPHCIDEQEEFAQ